VLVSVLIQVFNSVSTQPGLPPDTATVLQYGVYAIVLIVALLFIPRGIVPTVSDAIARRRRGRPRTAGAAAVSQTEDTRQSEGSVQA
jgi:branched-chain amino acid transport system permease protein